MSQWNAAWHHKSNYYEYPKHGEMIGLCPYMRMIIIWGPLAILSNLIPLGAVIGALFMFPMAANGAAGVGWLFFWVVLTVGLIVAWAFFKDWRDAKAEEKEKSQISSWDDEEEKPQGFIKLMYEWIHNKFCPILEVHHD
jgi:hypothetical protein